MADPEDDDLELDEQGNPKKPQPPPQAIGTPIQPTIGTSTPNKFQDVKPIMPQQQSPTAPTSIMPDTPPQAPPGAGSIGSPIQPFVPAPRPAAARAEELA